MNDSMVACRKILIAEDEIELQQLLAYRLTGLSLEVEMVSDGIEALQALLDGIKHDRSYPVIVLDCAMPFVDGFTVALTIRCLEKNRVLPYRTKIGMYTGYPEILAPKLIEETQIDYFIPKTDTEELIAMVTRLVGECE